MNNEYNFFVLFEYSQPIWQSCFTTFGHFWQLLALLATFGNFWHFWHFRQFWPSLVTSWCCLLLLTVLADSGFLSKFGHFRGFLLLLSIFWPVVCQEFQGIIENRSTLFSAQFPRFVIDCTRSFLSISSVFSTVSCFCCDFYWWTFLISNICAAPMQFRHW